MRVFFYSIFSNFSIFIMSINAIIKIKHSEGIVVTTVETKKKWYQKIKGYQVLTVFGFLIVLIALSTPFLVMHLTKTGFDVTGIGKLGTVGDFFGGTTVGLLSFASIIFVVATMKMQSHELEMQREELEMTREELSKTREEYEVTNKTMKLQQFETTFFNMINLYKDTLPEITHFSGHSGRSAIEGFYEQINHTLIEDSVSFYLKENVSSKYLGPYSEVVYHLILQKPQITESFFNFIDIPDTLTESVVYNILHFQTEETRIRKYKNIEHSDMEQLGLALPDNILVQGYLSMYYNDEEETFRKEAFYKVTHGEDSLSKYIKVVKLILGIVESLGNTISADEKARYYQIFLSQLSVYEKNLLFYYLHLGEDRELKRYNEQYTLIQHFEILENSIVLH